MAVVISERLRERGHRLLDAEPDERLVRLAQSGHDGAFAAIVRRYERELKAQAQRLTADGRGEDAVQQAFLNAFAALQRGREVRHLRGWLHQILRNEVTRGRLPLEAPLDAASISDETLEDTVQRRATAHATLVGLSALPERQRDALLGTAVFGLPRAHVARTMGLSEGAVRQLVHRARLRLRQAANVFIPFPLVKLLGAARSGVDAAPDAALGAGAAASGGLVVKVGALLATGAVATGIAVTNTFPTRHHSGRPAHGGGPHGAHTRAASHGASAPAPSVALGDAASVTNRVRLSEHGTPAPRTGDRSHGGPGRSSGTRSGRHGGEGFARGRGDDAGRGENGSGRRQDGGSGSGRDGDGSVSRSGTGSGSRSGSTTSSAGSSGSGSDDGGSSRDGGSSSGSSDGSGDVRSTGSGDVSSTGSGDVSSTGGAASTDSGSRSGSDAGPSGSASTPSATTIGADTSDGGGSSGGGGSDDGSSGSGSGYDSSGQSRDLSGSLDSSSS